MGAPSSPGAAPSPLLSQSNMSPTLAHRLAPSQKNRATRTVNADGSPTTPGPRQRAPRPGCGRRLFSEFCVESWPRRTSGPLVQGPKVRPGHPSPQLCPALTHSIKCLMFSILLASLSGHAEARSGSRKATAVPPPHRVTLTPLGTSPPLLPTGMTPGPAHGGCLHGEPQRRPHVFASLLG